MRQRRELQVRVPFPCGWGSPGAGAGCRMGRGVGGAELKEDWQLVDTAYLPRDGWRAGRCKHILSYSSQNNLILEVIEMRI